MDATNVVETALSVICSVCKYSMDDDSIVYIYCTFVYKH